MIKIWGREKTTVGIIGNGKKVINSKK